MKALMILMAAALPVLPVSAGTWFVDPVEGNDSESGRSMDEAWKSLAKVNALELKSGDVVTIAPGKHQTSLVPNARGSAEDPVGILFLPGVHEFPVETAVRRAYFISNSCASPEKPMPIGVLVRNCENLLLSGSGTGGKARTVLLMGGRMTHFINDSSKNIRYRQMVFDLKRPTVSEFRVIGAGENWSDIRIADGSTYRFEEGVFEWTGDIGTGRTLTQQAIPEEGRAWRVGVGARGNPLEQASRIESLGDDRFRLYFDGRKPLTVGHQFQLRNLIRDVVGAHNVRCEGITIHDVDFNAFAGMGIISQFCENLTYERVMVMPPEDSLRTCPAWADGFHFSGCRGQITIEGCVFSGMQDDPVNVHGTHLRIVEKRGENKLLVRFIHKQTYGFAAFKSGDEVAVIQASSLREYSDNPRRTVTAVERVNDRDWLLTLDGEAPRFEEDDVIDNVTWYPDLTIRDCYVDMNSCRGFLITTRGKVLVEGNTLKRCRMPGILIEGDSDGWFESGPIRDMTVRDNVFIGSGIDINPRVKEGDEPAYENIRIIGNTFEEGAGISAHHVKGLRITGNRSKGGELSLKLNPANVEAVVEDNE